MDHPAPAGQRSLAPSTPPISVSTPVVALADGLDVASAAVRQPGDTEADIVDMHDALGSASSERPSGDYVLAMPTSDAPGVTTANCDQPAHVPTPTVFASARLAVYRAGGVVSGPQLSGSTLKIGQLTRAARRAVALRLEDAEDAVHDSGSGTEAETSVNAANNAGGWSFDICIPNVRVLGWQLAIFFALFGGQSREIGLVITIVAGTCATAAALGLAAAGHLRLAGVAGIMALICAYAGKALYRSLSRGD